MSNQPINKLKDLVIYREYRCTECQHLLSKAQKATEDFLHKCPSCNDENGLVIESADTGLQVTVGLQQPKTVGALAEKNRAVKEKRGEISPKEARGMRETKNIPWWRKNKKKPDMSILKNPAKYIEKGIV